MVYYYGYFIEISADEYFMKNSVNLIYLIIILIDTRQHRLIQKKILTRSNYSSYNCKFMFGFNGFNCMYFPRLFFNKKSVSSIPLI